ncbi:hypothetical protein BU23DRAFT_528630 [Bimuria novae-zelandiae CBS 107.79]|uniref:RDRP core domain-containing protein n=1 Tax=Bimuria novae-zelandiae CBS 107.79 TaxID=1447943 RepID=A0A6A5VII3_9PLEO|nr:hypothetical protein BU23DRAFT_528630 [Bimuria novae-zelandiae CBS 107.79]
MSTCAVTSSPDIGWIRVPCTWTGDNVRGLANVYRSSFNSVLLNLLCRISEGGLRRISPQGTYRSTVNSTTQVHAQRVLKYELGDPTCGPPGKPRDHASARNAQANCVSRATLQPQASCLSLQPFFPSSSPRSIFHFPWISKRHIILSLRTVVLALMLHLSTSRIPTMSNNLSKPPQGARSQSAGPGLPTTPRKSGAEFYSLIRSLEEQWRLGLAVPDENWSPHKSANKLPDKVYAQLKRYYFKGDFEKAILRFSLRESQPTGPDTQRTRTARLMTLHETIRQIDEENGRDPGSRAGTPVSAMGGSNTGSRMLRPHQTSTPGSHRSTPSSGAYYTSRSNNGGPRYATAPDPGSPTDEDEPPPSPIASSRSAQRRVQGSQPFEKSSDTAIPAPLFKKPSLPSFRSHQAERSFNTVSSSQQTQSDMGRSFQCTSASTSFNNTLPSTQQTCPDTPGTSFSSEYTSAIESFQKETEGFRPSKRTSSTTMGSLDDEDLLAIDDAVQAQLKRESARLDELNRSSQDQPPQSSSTYGSVDEDVMVERSFTIEVEEEYTLLDAPEPLPQRTGSSSQDHLFAKGGKFPSHPSAERSPFYRPDERGHNAGLNERSSDTRAPAAPGGVLPRSPSTPSKDSPPKVPHYIRDIPEQNLFTEPLSQDLEQFPYFVLFICSRIAIERKIPLSMLLQGVDASSALNDSSTFLEQVCVTLNLSIDALKDHQRFWSAWRKDFEGYTFKARIEFNCPDSYNSSTPVFKLTILPIQSELSSRFQRKFGSDRLLYVNAPSFDTNEKTKPVRYTKDRMKSIVDQFRVWCEREHKFLGRNWRVFHIEAFKMNDTLPDDMSDKRIIMFATSGVGIDAPMSIGEMLNWFYPFEDRKNINQTVCKAYARLDLGLSRTIPALEFLPSQVILVKDVLADGTPENTKHNDVSIEWPQEYPKHVVMNDGCSRMSYGAALKIWNTVKEFTGSDDPLPSAFQGRIGGAKGVWMINDEPSFVNPDEPDWIEISKSQLKFNFHAEDRTDSAYDRHRVAFDYVDHSRKPVPKALHISFIPILVDRGVPWKVIADLTIERQDADRKQLLHNLSDPERMYPWVHREDRGSRSDVPQWEAGMQQYFPNKIKFLYESGFLPNQEPYLADCICSFIRSRQIRMESKLKVPLTKSTYVLGVADPLGVLAPGEVHMEFSSPFTDELTGARFRALDNIDILVSRQPACRRSDIQKVRSVKHPELSHLIDVVVFPAVGEYPLAGKLQGGDYDGDTFWLCWEQAVVQSFKNAPAPVETPEPSQYGIKQDTRRLSEIMDANDLSTVDNFLREALEFRLKPSLLGLVTNYSEKLAYLENRVASKSLQQLYDIHDLLVDAPKQGYMYTKEDFDRFTRNVLDCGNPKMPAYKQAMEDCEGKKGQGTDEKITARTKDYKHKNNNILDYLYFEVVRTHNVATLKAVEERFPNKINDDCTLQYPYLQLRKEKSKVIREELDNLIKALAAVEVTWRVHFPPDSHILPGQRDRAINRCYENYCSILPSQTDHPDIKPWTYPYKHHEYSVWESIRASALYTMMPKRVKLPWLMAGKQLADIKGASCPGATVVVPRMKAIMRPRNPKAPKPQEDESDDEFESALEEWTNVPRPILSPQAVRTLASNNRTSPRATVRYSHISKRVPSPDARSLK